jgi:hypothetical protein
VTALNGDCGGGGGRGEDEEFGVVVVAPHNV